jgi:TRAP-type C4-dicarboxylate transport system substrate-binding protein
MVQSKVHLSSSARVYAVVMMFLMAVVAGCGGTPTPTPTQPAASQGASQAKPEKPAEPAKTYEIKIAHGSAPTSAVHTDGAEVFKKLVEQKSAGRIKVNLFPAAQLGAAKKHFELVKGGVAEAAITLVTYHPEELPVNNLMLVPGLYDQLWTGIQGLWRALHEPGPMRDEFTTKGVVPLAVFSTPEYEVQSTNRPLKSLDDLKGLRLRSSGGLMNEALKLLGATPVEVPAADMVGALQARLVDGTALPLYTFKTYGLDKLVKYSSTDLGVGPGAPFILFMNAKFFYEMPEDLRKILYDAGKETSYAGMNGHLKLNEAAVATYKDKVQFVEFGPKVRQEAANKLVPLKETWVSSVASIGIDGKKVIDQYQGLVKASTSKPQDWPDYKWPLNK